MSLETLFFEQFKKQQEALREVIANENKGGKLKVPKFKYLNSKPCPCIWYLRAILALLAFLVGYIIAISS